MKCPEYAPNLPVPGAEEEGAADQPPRQGMSLPPYMGTIFPALCEFWRIAHDVVVSYHQGGRSSSQLAEYKYRELLAWAESLPGVLADRKYANHQAMTLQ
jgi:hypothetical protein